MASIYDKASLVLIPSGTKTSKVYSQKPTNGDGDFTFSRSTAATRVNASGNIEKETGNLLLQSNQFDTTWTLDAGMTLISGQSGYDGTSNAWLLDKPATNFREMKQSVTYSGVSTYSIYAKSGSLTAMTLRFVDGVANHYARFDLSSGSPISSTGNVIDMVMTDVGGGWYRCSTTIGSITGNQVYVYPDIEYNQAAGYIYIQDAQLEQGLVARDYIETTTTAIYGGITDNVPRLDYQGSCPALLLEPQRTNLVTSSEYFSSIVAVTSSYVDSPEGLNNATRLTENTSTSQHYSAINVSGIISGNKYAISFYVRQGSYSSIQVYTQSSKIATTASIFFSTETISVSGAVAGSPFMTPVGNGWYRCGWVGTAIGDGNMDIYAPVVNLSSSVGDGTSYIDYYGFQVEDDGAGGGSSYATSYIPTYGSAVTRNADSCLNAGNASTFNSTEGVLYWEGSFDSTSTIAGAIALIGANSNRVQLYNSGSNLVVLVTPNGSTSFTASTNGSVDITSNHKYAVKWALNDFAFWVDGVEIATDTSGVTFNDNALTELRFSDFGANYLYANTKQVLTFNTALSNNELQDLTTL